MGGFLKVDINRSDLFRIVQALHRIDAIVTIQKNQLPYECSIDYKNLVIQNILTQKFATTYRPYSPRYAKWKTQQMLGGSHFWRLYGDLLKSISAFRTSDGWMGGIPAGAMDSGGKSWFSTRGSLKGAAKSIAMYAKVMEHGLNRHPARPVFGPTAQEYRQSGYKVRASRSLGKIRFGWR